MKICIVCSKLCYGGAERVAVLWANGFYGRGHDVMVLSNLYEPITYKLNDGIIVRGLVSTNKNKLKKWLGSVSCVRKNLKFFRPDVVISVLATCSFVSRLATCGLGIPVVATEHDSFERPPSAPFSFWNWASKFIFNKLYNYVTVLTLADKCAIGNRLKSIHVMPNPLALAPSIENYNRKYVVLAAGRLDDWHCKGFDVLINAWGTIMKNESITLKNSLEGEESLKRWRLQIAGTGCEESLKCLMDMCKENGVEDSVDFLGFRKDIENLYRQSEVFVLSSRYEGFGLVLIEAMSQGCACVACDYKGRQREIIEDDSQGLCCEPDNIDALGTALRRMMEDKEYRESVRSNAIARSKVYCIDNVISKWEDLLCNVVQAEANR